MRLYWPALLYKFFCYYTVWKGIAIILVLTIILVVMRRQVIRDRRERRRREAELIRNLPSLLFADIKAKLPDLSFSFEECSICLGAFEEESEVIPLACKHLFHKECIEGWFVENNTCPNDRRETSLEGINEMAGQLKSN